MESSFCSRADTRLTFRTQVMLNKMLMHIANVISGNAFIESPDRLFIRFFICFDQNSFQIADKYAILFNVSYDSI
jgi:hypothetical protein